MRRLARSILLASFVLLAGEARAEERIFVLKDGRKVRGELVAEEANAYVVKTGGETVKLAKDSVLKTESPLPRRSVEGNGGLSWRPSGNEAESAKDELGEAIKKLKEASGGAVRAEDLDPLLNQVKLASLASLVTLPQNASRQLVSVAVALLVRAGPKARPYVANALATVPDTPSYLLRAAVQIGDERSLFEKPILEGAQIALHEGKPAGPWLDALASLGTKQSFPDLLEAFLDDNYVSYLPALGGACEGILKRESAPDTLLAPALPQLQAKNHARLAQAFNLLAHSKGRALSRVDELLQALDRDLAAASPPLSGTDEDCLTNGLLALARIGTPQAYASLGAYLERTSLEAGRTRAITAFASARSETKLDAVSALVDVMERRREWPGSEQSLANEILLSMTGESHGFDIEAWREGLKRLRAAAAEAPSGADAPRGGGF